MKTYIYWGILNNVLKNFKGGAQTQKKIKLKVKLEFYEEWKTKYKWLKEIKHERKIVMKCIYDETHKATEPWGIDIG